MKKYVILAGTLAVTAGIVTVGTKYYQNHKNTNHDKTQESTSIISIEQQQADFKLASQLIATSKPEEAIKIIKKYNDEMEKRSETGLAWLSLYIDASAKNQNNKQLANLYLFQPEKFKDNEEASLMVADHYIRKGDLTNYYTLRDQWKNRETKESTWFVLDVDALFLEGKRQEAEVKLNSKTFPGKDDVGRLTRLALYHANENPKESWKYLNTALAKDPNNPDIRSYRAQLLEHLGKNKLAHKEYRALAEVYENNLFLKDQLAEFYRRQGKYHNALEVWETVLPPPSLDSIWVKAYFWNRVSTPIAFNWQQTPIPQGNLDPMIKYLISLKPDQFWNRDAFTKIAKNDGYQKNLQETYWLRLLDALKNGRELEAMQMLEYNDFAKRSYDPDLEMGLKNILYYRQFGTMHPKEEPKGRAERKSQSETELNNAEINTAEIVINDETPFFQALDILAKQGPEAKIPDDLAKLLKSDEVFAVAFISAKWLEAGLQLHKMEVIPADFPQWVPFVISQSIHINRTPKEALEFAENQPPSDLMSLMTAELMISTGNPKEALEKLAELSKLNSEIGYRSAYLAALLYIEQKDYAKAKAVIQGQPRLLENITGQETMARIALLEGNMDAANQMYSKISDKSTEARSFLAKVAFEAKDWKRAKELTESLLVEEPDNKTLQKNLELINEKNGKS